MNDVLDLADWRSFTLFVILVFVKAMDLSVLMTANQAPVEVQVVAPDVQK